MQDTPELEQARFWWELTPSNANHGTIRGFIEAVLPLKPEDGPEAKRFLRIRRSLLSLLKDQARDLGKAVRQAARIGLKAPVYNLRAGFPVVQGDFLVAKQVLRWQCPPEYAPKIKCRSLLGARSVVSDPCTTSVA